MATTRSARSASSWVHIPVPQAISRTLPSSDQPIEDLGNAELEPAFQVVAVRRDVVLSSAESVVVDLAREQLPVGLVLAHLADTSRHRAPHFLDLIERPPCTT